MMDDEELDEAKKTADWWAGVENDLGITYGVSITIYELLDHIKHLNEIMYLGRDLP